MKKIVQLLTIALLVTGLSYQCLADGKDDKKCVMMKDGKMVVKEKGKITPMTADMRMDDGTTVSTTGMVTKPDGTTRMLANGEKVDMDGNIKMKDKDMKDKKMDKKKDDKKY